MSYDIVSLGKSLANRHNKCNNGIFNVHNNVRWPHMMRTSIPRKTPSKFGYYGQNFVGTTRLSWYVIRYKKATYMWRHWRASAPGGGWAPRAGAPAAARRRRGRSRAPDASLRRSKTNAAPPKRPGGTAHDARSIYTLQHTIHTYLLKFALTAQDITQK